MAADLSGKSLVIIGAGLAGLVCAHDAARRGARVVLLEKEGRTGGVISSRRIEGFLCEAGPNSMLLKSARVESYLRQLGLDDDLVQASPSSDKRFLVKDGRVLALPMGPVSAITTPMYSFGAKLRLLKEPFVGRAGVDDESVASFVTRRMGREFLDYGITALVSGIYSGDPEKLSIRHAFPKVWNLEHRYGSLIGGSVKLMRERKRTGEKRYRSKTVSFLQGLETLPQRLVQRTEAEINTSATVTDIDRSQGAWRVRWNKDGHSNETLGDALVVAVPAWSLGELPWADELAGSIGSLPRPHYPPITTLVLGFRREQVGHPLDGFGVLVPLVEKRDVLGVIFSSSLFPERAPEGHVSLMVFIGGVTRPELACRGTDETIESALAEVRDLLDVQGDPVFARPVHWPLGVPQYDVGHGHFLDALSGAEARFPGLYFSGNYRGGPGISDVIGAALELGDRMRDDLPASPADQAAATA